MSIQYMSSISERLRPQRFPLRPRSSIIDIMPAVGGTCAVSFGPLYTRSLYWVQMLKITVSTTNTRRTRHVNALFPPEAIASFPSSIGIQLPTRPPIADPPIPRKMTLPARR